MTANVAEVEAGFFTASRALPDRWRRVRLGDVCEIVMGQSPVGSSYNPKGLGEPLLNGPTEFGAVHPIPVQWTTEPVRFAEPRDILFCVRGATTGRKNIADQRYCIGRGLAAIRGKDGQATTEFLTFLLDYVTSKLLLETAGSTFPNLPGEKLEKFEVPLPPLSEQKRIAEILNKQMVAVERAHAAAESQLDLSSVLINSILRESFKSGALQPMRLSECTLEVTKGIGASWKDFPVLGATRAGLAPAKEPVGKNPERYKPVDVGTIFYNPMRILIGSIAVIGEGDEPGITSPDYVALRTQEGVLHYRWFYHWLRSHHGGAFIKTLARGAVRERMLYKRLASAEMEIPSWQAQLRAAEQLQVVRQLRERVTEQLDSISKLPPTLLRRVFNVDS